MPRENLAGRAIAGYRLLERVGEGGTATVYRAEHPERGRCALKVLRERMRTDATAVKRFLREAGYHSRVQHPAVVRTYDYGEEDGLHYLALEWADGEALSAFVHRSGRLAPELTAHIVTQLAAGIQAAHSVGIIHRDLKPENIAYNPASRSAKLLDFGIARDSQLDAAERLTRTGFFVGTLNYVAPEALSGELVNEAADTYSMATITYYLLTGRHPYTGKSPRELFQQLLTQPPTPLNQAVKGLAFPVAVEHVVMRALSRNPGDRQGSVVQFAEQLQQAVTGGGSVPRSADEGGGLVNKLKSILGGRRGSGN
ncbi:MAG: protein kinase [Gemmatimonadales bacterium]|nr:protein kinase [Gemmatimonadales bacterium]NIN10439.1 protein kinase [Gemmatimonadales bacterium]NIN49231.1 protein kinase [Gemmatimonadales bacterium]NIP06695.1 protein kinase [Gemmatimonadales bacterium]NIR00026.1 protein kinase [Gemmatimonadales bacterium]